MNIIFNKQSAVPYYHQIKEAVKAMITSGELKPGDMLLSEFSLSEQLGISRLVVHLGIPVIEGKIRGVWAGFAHPTSPIYPITTANPREQMNEKAPDGL